MLLELNEVESGMYETTPSYTHYFLQTLAAIGKERITDDLFGDWQFTRSGKADVPVHARQHRLRCDSFMLTSNSAATDSSRASPRSRGSSTVASS